MKSKFTVILALLMALCVPAMFGQSPMTQTTLSAAITNASNSVSLASTTGFNAPALNPSQGGIGGPTSPNESFAYVDRELMRIVSVTSTGITVQRGWSGTKAVPHNSGAVVYTAGGKPFVNSYLTGACVAANYGTLPVLDYTAGVWYTCPTVGPNANVWAISNEQSYQNLSDYSWFVPPTSCVGATTGTPGTGNDTLIVDGSVPALKISATSGGASVNTFTCTFEVNSRLTAGKGVTLTSLDFLYSPQSTTATSQTLSTMNSFTGPVAAASETASSATLVAAGGTVTQVPVVASANLTAVSAGQYYTSRAVFGTPIAVNSARQTFVFTFVISQSASAAQIVTTPGFWVNANQDVF